MLILVTGSDGVIGTELCKQLRIAGHTVYGVDLAHSPHTIPFHPHLYGDGNSFRADVGNFREISRVFDKLGIPDFVYHTAAEFGRWNGQDYYERMWASNCVGVRNMLELQVNYGFKCVYFSSSEVYGDHQGVMGEDVAESCSQLNDYAISKWANEQQILSTSGVDAIRVRLFNTYGPGEYYTPYRSVACRFAYRLLNRLPITVSRGHERSHTWLPDCVRAMVSMTTNECSGVYNIGTTNSHTIEELASYLVDLTGASPDLVSLVEGERQTTKKKTVCNKRAVRDLGYADTVDLREGLRQTVEWMRGVYG